MKTSERCLVSFGVFRVRINVNILDREKNDPKPTAGRKLFAFRDAIIARHYLNRNHKFTMKIVN